MEGELKNRRRNKDFHVPHVEIVSTIYLDNFLIRIITSATEAINAKMPNVRKNHTPGYLSIQDLRIPVFSIPFLYIPK